MRSLIFTLATSFAVAGILVAAEEKSGTLSSSNAPTQHKVLTPSDLTWVDAPPGLPAGAKIAVLDGDPTKKGLFTIRLQTPDGYKIPPHTHPTVERITVISGTFHIGMGDKFDDSAARELTAGGYVALPARMKHFGWTTGDTIVQINSEGPFVIQYVNPADDPRGTKK